MGFAGLVAAVTFVAAASPVAIAATPSRHGRVPPPDSRLYRRHHLPPPPKTRPPPSPAEITTVVDENLDSIKVCYQRALATDVTLTYGRIVVKLGIGISGRVKHVGIDGLPEVRVLLERCIRDAVSRWVFPQASEEYGTQFPFALQNDYVDHEDIGNGCSITVNSIPWSEVWIDGKNTTLHTPVVRFRLPCGKHKLTFKREDMHIDHTETITLRPGTKFMHLYALTLEDY